MRYLACLILAAVMAGAAMAQVVPKPLPASSQTETDRAKAELLVLQQKQKAAEADVARHDLQINTLRKANAGAAQAELQAVIKSLQESRSKLVESITKMMQRQSELKTLIARIGTDR